MRWLLAVLAAVMLTLAACGGGYNYPPGSGPSCQLACAPSPTAPAPGPRDLILDSSCNPAADTTGTDTKGEKVICASGITQDPSDNGPTWETP